MNWAQEATGFEEQFKQSDYKYLGWQLSFANEDFKRCYDLGHMQNTTNRNFRTVREQAFGSRGSHHTNWCTECKIWWNIDMSD
jgi:hypothetical protein